MNFRNIGWGINLKLCCEGKILYKRQIYLSKEAAGTY